MNKLKVDVRSKTSRIVTMIIAVDHLQRCLRKKTQKNYVCKFYYQTSLWKSKVSKLKLKSYLNSVHSTLINKPAVVSYTINNFHCSIITSIVLCNITRGNIIHSCSEKLFIGIIMTSYFYTYIWRYMYTVYVYNVQSLLRVKRTAHS